MTNERDNQKSKVYKSERFMEDRPEDVLDWDGVLAFAKKVYGSTYVQNKYRHPQMPRFVKRSGQGGVFNAWNHEIRLGVWARQRQVILHEICHHLTYVMYGDGCKHGWQFASIDLDMVRHFFGKEDADQLKANFKANRVKFTKPRPKRQLTDEQRAVLVERMARARAAKQLMSVARAATVDP